MQLAANGAALLDGLATVDDDRAANDEPSSIRTKPEDGISIFFRPPHSSDWLLRDTLRSPLGGPASEPRHHRSVDIAGTDGVNADVLSGVVQGSRLGKANH